MYRGDDVTHLSSEVHPLAVGTEDWFNVAHCGINSPYSKRPVFIIQFCHGW